MPIYHLIALVISACILALSPHSARAAVMERDWKTPGDGLLTFDDVNNREWLDLTETQLFKFPGAILEERYQAVLAETLPGGMFEEFSVATTDDVIALAESAGIDTTTMHFKINEAASDSLIQLLGNPVSGAAPTNKWAGGFLDDGVLSTSLAVAFVPIGRDHPSAGIGVTNFLGAANGIWLYRAIPEPSTCILIGNFLGLLVLLHRKVGFAKT